MPEATYYVHPSAVIDEPCHIGAGTKIWHFCHVMVNSRIGQSCILGQNVFVASGVCIGNHVKVQNNVSIYEGVIIEDDVFCGPSMVFTNVRNPRAQVVRRNEYLTTRVMRGATLGANCTIVCGVTIGEYAFVGAGAVVNRDVLPFALVVGVPAKHIGWISKHGERLDLPLEGSGEAQCITTGERYRLENGRVLCLNS